MRQSTGASFFKLSLDKYGSTVAIVILLLVTIGLYGSLLNAPYLPYDDDTNIFSNYHFLSGNWTALWQAPYYGVYVPVTSTVWVTLWSLGEGAAWPFRVLNLALHLANTTLIFFGVRRLGRKLNQGYFPDSAAIIAAAFFALHPLQVGTVAWISGGRDLLAAFLSLSSLFSLARFLNRTGVVLSSLLFIAALLSKPSAASIPLAVILFVYLYHRTVFRRTFILMAVWALFSMGIAAFTFYSQGADAPMIGSSAERALVVLDAFGFHLFKIFAPLNLATDYGRTPSLVLSSLEYWLPTSALAIGVFIGLLKTSKPYRFGLLWFVLMLPVSGIIGFAFQLISTVSDHYNYLPLGIVATVIGIGSSNVIRHGHRKTLLVISLVIGSLLVFISWERVNIWRMPITFFEDMANQNPTSYVAAVGLGGLYCSSSATADQGLEKLKPAFEARPNDLIAFQNQLACLLRLSRADQILELEPYLKSPELMAQYDYQDPATALLLQTLAVAWFQKGNISKALTYSCQAFRIFPTGRGFVNNVRVLLSHLNRKPIPEDECPPYIPIADFLEKMVEH